MARRWRRWTPEEDALIREHFHEHGGHWGEWKRLMPDRLPTRDDINHRARALGVRCNNRFRYGVGNG